MSAELDERMEALRNAERHAMALTDARNHADSALYTLTTSPLAAPADAAEHLAAFINSLRRAERWAADEIELIGKQCGELWKAEQSS